MRFIARLTPIVVLFAAASWPQDADPKTVDELLQGIEEKSGSVNSWTADTTMSISMAGMPMTGMGTIKVKNKLSATVMTMLMMGQSTVMRSVTGADGIAWSAVEMNGMTQVMKMDPQKMTEMGSEMLGIPLPGAPSGSSSGAQAKARDMIESYGTMYGFEIVGEGEAGGVPVRILKGTITGEAKDAIASNPMMAAMGMSMDTVMLYIGIEDGFLRKTEMLGADDAPFMTQEYSNLVFGAEIDDSVFEFVPPTDVPVMDMSEMLQGVLDGAESEETEEAYNTKFKAGDTAPDFEGTGLDGKAVKLADYKGKVVLLDFWATWCGPCVAEMPHVIELYGKHHPAGLEIIGISLDEGKKELKAFVAEHPGMDWPQIFEKGGWKAPIAVLHGVNAIPHTLLLDREGVIHAADLRGEELDGAVAELLATAAK